MLIFFVYCLLQDLVIGYIQKGSQVSSSLIITIYIILFTGQSFSEFSKNNQPIKDKSKIIYLLPLEPIVSMSLIQKLEYMVHGFYYQVQVKLLSIMDITKNKSIKTRSQEDVSRRQYHAGDLLNYLEKIRPKDAFCLVGFLISDIYPKEEWNFVFGLADSTKRVGVFSFARYHESFFQNKIFPDEKIDNPDLVAFRACKVMCHELGHLFNMRHCIYYSCLMNGSNSLEEASTKPFQLCPICLRKLMYKMNAQPLVWLKVFSECLNDIGVGKFIEDAKKINEQLKVLK